MLAHETVVDCGLGRRAGAAAPPALPERDTTADLQRARAFAYGGSVIQDLGYYPFGNKLFTDLVHYVRSGDFVEALLRDARTVDELAFALGAVAHYASDNIGHPVAVNKSVPMIYPKLRAKYGDDVIYAEDPDASRDGRVRLRRRADRNRRVSARRASRAHRLRAVAAGARARVRGDLRHRLQGAVRRRRTWRSARSATRSAS